MNQKSFEKLLKTVRGATSRDELADATRSGLESILSNPQDQQLLASLQAKAANIAGALPAGAKVPLDEIRQAIVRCVLLLENAQKSGTAPPKSKWPLIVLVSVGGMTALLYLILVISRYR